MVRTAGRTAALLLLLAGAAQAAEPGESGAPATKSVLLLNQQERSFPALLLFIDAFRDALGVGREPIGFYVEDFDVDRFGRPGYFREIRQWLRAKYHDTPPDVIVAAGFQVLHQVLRFRDELWPKVPVVFTAVDGSAVDTAALPPDVTGVTIGLDVRGTLDLALALLPDTRRVVCVGRGAYTHDAVSDLRATAIERGLEFLDLGDVPLDELMRRLGALPEHTIVYYRQLFTDTAGRVLAPAEALDEVATASNRPIFSDAATFLGHGMVGGSLIDPEALARETALPVLRILHGEPATAIPITQSAASYPGFDWRQLERWHLDERRLPAGSVIRYRPTRLWDEYWAEVLGASIIIALQALLIVALLFERRGRRHAELEARRRLEESAHLNRVAALGELASTLAHELNQPLAAILSNAQAARRLLDARSPDLDELRETVDDIAADDKRAGAVIRRMRNLLKKGELAVAPVDLDTVVRDAARFVRSSALHRGATIELNLDGALPPIAGDAVQLQQVILNLLVNGLDAMDDAPRHQRRVVVRTGRADGREIELSVHDPGKGIRAEDLDRLFDPFFSTKASGLGVGLAISRSIVQAHGGRIWVESEAEHGTTFHCVFPTAKGQRA